MVPEFLESGRRSMNHVLYAGLHVDLIAMTEQPPTEVGGFTRVAGDWKSTHYAPRVGNAASSQIACSSKPKEAARLKLTGWKPVALTL